MARTKHFDRDTALEAAMTLFWKRGYHATSVQMLVDATGLSRSSLYASFGDKQVLFLAAIELYLESVNRARIAQMMASESPRDGIEQFFNDMIDFSTGKGKRLGCLLTNSAIEFGRGDGEVQARIFGVFSSVESAFAKTVARGQARKEIATAQSPQAMARFLMTLVQGVRVMSQVNPKKAWLRSALAVGLGVIDHQQAV